MLVTSTPLYKKFSNTWTVVSSTKPSFHKSDAMKPQRKMSCTLALCLYIACALVDVCMCGSANNSRCKPRHYTHKAIQTDMSGRRCWGEVKILSCWGYCLSYEIADWQFPYKESHHPVCVHGDRRHASSVLKHCDTDVDPSTQVYHYVEAQNCKCKICSSEDTSCEWLPDSTALEGLLPRPLDDEDDLMTI